MELVEEANEPKKNQRVLSSGDKVFVFLVALASAPGYITALILVFGYIVDFFVGHYYHSPFHDRLVYLSGSVAWVLPLVGIATHPVALLVASIGSFCRISRRGKVLAWMTALGGILGLAFAYGVIWIPYGRQ